MFNNGQFWEKVQQGEMTAKVLKDRHPSLPLANEPFCTRSQLVAYFNDQNERVALVHQYLRTDGTIGASGRPDPKRLLLNGILYAVL
ncbi:MAG: hypothetical protein HY011_18355 [Acidobacteria bacterium]|nr:hypothetical protein [Acidobacteriota bacterium]